MKVPDVLVYFSGIHEDLLVILEDSPGIPVHFPSIQVDFPGIPGNFSGIQLDFPDIPSYFPGLTVDFSKLW